MGKYFKIKLGFLATLLICVVLSPAALAVSDPLGIGVGARPLGMGKAYVAFAEGPESLFVNPAGLSSATHLQATSMNCNLMEDIGYLVLGGSIPLTSGQTLGLGIVSAGSSNITLRDSDGDATGTADYNTSVYLLSYAVDLNKTLGINNLYLGSNLKFYTQTITGSSLVTDGNGSGINLDLGLIYKVNPWIKLGLTQQNLLPSSWGGSMKYQSGYSEDFYAITKLGSSFKILGEENRSLFNSPYDLSVAVDADFYNNYACPTLWHFGGELWPTEFLALRLGVDHDTISSNTTAAYLAGGLGIKYQGFAFDYAYHPLGELAEDATHFFSISYVGEDNETVVSVTEPTKESTSHVIALKHFIDVPDGYWAKDAIEYSATANIVNGYPDGTFRPDSPISRAELSAILVRVKDLKLAEALSQSVFKDVKPSHWAAKYVWAAKYENFITGYPNQTFKPANKITRAEGTSLFARFEKLQLPDYIVERPFPDIATRHWAAKEIQAAGSFGFLKYLEGMYFRPNRPMSRAEAVAMLTKTTVGKAKIDDFFKYNVTIVEGPYPFKDFYVASNPTDTNTTKTKQKTLTKVTKETATKTSTKAKESSSSLTQQQYAQARLERLKKIKVYLKESRGVYITGKTTMPNESGKAMQVYILSDGNFMLIQDSGTKVSAVSIYNPKTGKWTNLSIDAVASVNQ